MALANLFKYQLSIDDGQNSPTQEMRAPRQASKGPPICSPGAAAQGQAAEDQMWEGDRQ
jgi:hypothetical protein